MRALLIKSFLRLTALLPLSLIHRIGAGVGRLALRYDKNMRRVSEINIKRCFPQIGSEAQQTLVKNSAVETGKTIAETGMLWFGSQARVHKSFAESHGLELIEAARAKGKGVIIALPHLGSWEAVGLFCSARYPTTSLYRPPRLQALDDTVRQARQRFGAHLVPTTARGVKSLYQALADNHVVFILPDQDPRRGAGQFAPFFGIEANTMILLSRLAQKTGTEVLCGYAERLPQGHGFALRFSSVDEGVYSKDMTASLTALNQSLEKLIVHRPEQYQWSYKRFETRPEGEKGFY